jgi:RNA polymerase sigma-70 factor (ECF subfamily)
MPNSASEFNALMQRLRNGDNDAACELLDKYGEHILRFVRRKLHKQLRSKFDSVDFVQAVWASFFADLPDNDFDRPQALMAFLITLAQHKLVEAVRQRLGTAKYDVTREHPLDGRDAGPTDGLAGREPTPSQVALANDEWREMVTSLPRQYQHMLALLREGHTHQEIADALGVNERTIRRLLDKLAPERKS